MLWPPPLAATGAERVSVEPATAVIVVPSGTPLAAKVWPTAKAPLVVTTPMTSFEPAV